MLSPEALPKMMTAVILNAPGSVSVCSVPVPEPGPGELLLKVMASTTCGTDLKAFLRGHPMIPMPGPLGHEYSGVVVSPGEGAEFHCGDAVMGVHSAPCQSCFWCLRGQENLCESIMTTKVLGSFAEYLLVPERIARLNVFPKPESLSFETASLLEPLSCVAEGLSLLNLSPNSGVLVIGPGAIGLMFVAGLRAMGVRDITLAGRNAARLAVGERMGARAAQISDVPIGGAHGYDIVIECTGQLEIWEKSVDYSRRGGTVVLFGGCPAGTRASFDTRRLHYDQITLLSPFHFGAGAVRQAREWLMSPAVDLASLVSEGRSLSDAEQVFRDLQAGKALKYVFKP